MRISVGSFPARAVWAIFSLQMLFHQATPQRAKCILHFKATSCGSGLIRERSANLHAAIFHLLLLYFQTLLTIINPALWLRCHKSVKSVCTRINLCSPPPLHSTATQLRAPLGCHNTAHTTRGDSRPVRRRRHQGPRLRRSQTLLLPHGLGWWVPHVSRGNHWL